VGYNFLRISVMVRGELELSNKRIKEQEDAHKGTSN
jgi:hypothetical protein